MEKFINFVKKPLVIISGALFGVFLIMLIVICAIPHGKTYTWSYDIMGQHVMDIEMSFDKDTILMTIEYDKDVAASEGIPENQRRIAVKNDYEIRNGELYTREEGATTFDYSGKISAFKITMSGEDMGVGYNDLKVELICHTNVAIRTVSVVFMIISALVLAGSITVLVLDKKGILKTETANAKAKIESEEPAKENENTSETKTTEVVEEKTEEKTEKE